MFKLLQMQIGSILGVLSFLSVRGILFAFLICLLKKYYSKLKGRLVWHASLDSGHNMWSRNTVEIFLCLQRGFDTVNRKNCLENHMHVCALKDYSNSFLQIAVCSFAILPLGG